MISPSTNDWFVPTLNEIAACLSSSGMHESAVAVMKAAAVVHQNSGAPAMFGPPAPMTSAPMTSAPMIEGNIIRFSVYSRNRR